MKNLILTCVAILMMIAFVSCGDDDATACEQSSFVGTYTLVGDSICTADNSIIAPLSFFLTAGSAADIVLENGEEDLALTIVDCNAADTFVSYTLDGESMISQVGDCQWTYSKN